VPLVAATTTTAARQCRDQYKGSGNENDGENNPLNGECINRCMKMEYPRGGALETGLSVHTTSESAART
jgi:hypothetical protein